MPFFLCVPSLMLLFAISLVFGTGNYLLKDSDSVWSFERPTVFDKAWFVSNFVVLSFFF